MRSSQSGGSVEEPGETLARLRHGLYRFFAAAFLEPDEGRVAALRAVSEYLSSHELERFAFFDPWNRLTRLLRDGCDPEELRAEYVRLFSGASGPSAVSPHEADVVTPPGSATGQVLAGLATDYAALGLNLSPGLTTRPDHVSVEMEAMASLCDREAEARRSGSSERTARALEGQRRLLDRHLGAWFPGFADRVVRRAGGGFYAALAEAARGFIDHDRSLVVLLTTPEDEVLA